MHAQSLHIGSVFLKLADTSGKNKQSYFSRTLVLSNLLRMWSNIYVKDRHKNVIMLQVPINVCIGSNPTAVKSKILLTEKEQTFIIDNVKEGEWVKLNAGTTGFYRVEYSEEMLNALLPDISNKNMPVLDRFGITNDLFALVEVRCFINNMSKNFFFLSLDSQRAMLRALVQGRLAKAGHAPTIEKARMLFAEHIQAKKELHPDLRLADVGCDLLASSYAMICVYLKAIFSLFV
uniref:ERAP1_C domain-containing protein n=1 Tax=Heterorhabditis bacteriophora TaxID=37862 RepID=A0A1I7X455_HETBA